MYHSWVVSATGSSHVFLERFALTHPTMSSSTPVNTHCKQFLVLQSVCITITLNTWLVLVFLQLMLGQGAATTGRIPGALPM